MRVFTSAVGSTKPLQVRLEQRGSDGAWYPLPLRGGSVRFTFRDAVSDVLMASGAGTVVRSDGAETVVSYGWLSGGNQQAGLWACRIEATQANGTVVTLPDGDAMLPVYFGEAA